MQEEDPHHDAALPQASPHESIASEAESTGLDDVSDAADLPMMPASGPTPICQQLTSEQNSQKGSVKRDRQKLMHDVQVVEAAR